MAHCVLTIAGSDSGGNAGIQADLRMFHAYSLHGCTAFTSLTAQNPNEVCAIHDIPAEFVAAQLDAVLDIYSIGALKTGMRKSRINRSLLADIFRGFCALSFFAAGLALRFNLGRLCVAFFLGHLEVGREHRRGHRQYDKY